jgi:hypothetical protein
MANITLKEMLELMNKDKNKSKDNLESKIEHDCSVFSNKTESPVYMNKFAKGEAKLVYMTPQSYLMECKKIHNYKGSLNDYINEAITKKLAKKYSINMNNGDKFPIPVLDYELESQEGRHRIKAAELLGYSHIPVIVLEKQ